MLANVRLPLCSRVFRVAKACRAVRELRVQAVAATQAPDMQLEPPAPGTVKAHDQHFFLWAPQPEGRADTGEPDWPSKVERLPVMLNAFKAVSAVKLKEQMKGTDWCLWGQLPGNEAPNVKITAYEEACPGDTAPPKPGHCHCLAFPEGASFYNLPQNKLSRVISVLCGSMIDNSRHPAETLHPQNAIEGADNVDLDIPWESPGLPRLDHDLKLLQGELLGLHLFVCAHGSRDMRCGQIGNAVVNRLTELVGQWGYGGQVHVYRCSHVGGHKYAGNVIVCGQLSPCDGDWFGGVTEQNASKFLERLVKMEVGSEGPHDDDFLRQLWRGRLGYDKAEQLAAAECACAAAG